METEILSENINNTVIFDKHGFLENKEDKIYKLRLKLEIGEQSRTVKNFNSHDYLQKLHEKYL